LRHKSLGRLVDIISTYHVILRMGQGYINQNWAWLWYAINKLTYSNQQNQSN